MPYIVKSSLDIGGKIIPYNEQETNKLIKEKEDFLKQKEKKEVKPVEKEKAKKNIDTETNIETETVENKKNKGQVKKDV